MGDKLAQKGQDDEALKQYKGLLKYSKKLDDYARIPPLLARMGNAKAVITYLYLARYQIEAKAYKEVISSLEKAFELNKSAHLPLVRCYHFLGHKQEATRGYLALAKKHASKNAPEHRQRAVTLCQDALKVDPLHLETYRFLASLLPRQQHQAHIYLKAALHFIQAGDVKNGEALCKKAHQLCPKSPIVHHLPHLRLLLKQNKATEAVKLYLDLASIYTTKPQLPDRIFCFENLLALAPKDEYYKQIITAYHVLDNKGQTLRWYLAWINKLISEQKWEQAESTAIAALNQGEYTKVLTRLEAVYGSWQGHKLSDLWMRLGTRYEQNKQVTLAEKVYRKAYQRFHEYRHTTALAKLLLKTDKKPEGVQMFYQAANSALLAGNLNELNSCVEAIRAVDCLATITLAGRRQLQWHVAASLKRWCFQLSRSLSRRLTAAEFSFAESFSFP